MTFQTLRVTFSILLDRLLNYSILTKKLVVGLGLDFLNALPVVLLTLFIKLGEPRMVCKKFLVLLVGGGMTL